MRRTQRSIVGRPGRPDTGCASGRDHGAVVVSGGDNSIDDEEICWLIPTRVIYLSLRELNAFETDSDRALDFDVKFDSIDENEQVKRLPAFLNLASPSGPVVRLRTLDSVTFERGALRRIGEIPL